MVKLTERAKRLLADIDAHCGGELDERAICARTGLSHGYFSGARRELVEAGCIEVRRVGRKPSYIVLQHADASDVTTEAGGVAEADAAGSIDAPAASPPAPAAAVLPRPLGERRRAQRDTACMSGAARPSDVMASGHVSSLPRVVGDFTDLEDWQDALTDALGTVYISEALTGGGTYTVYACEHDEEDTYCLQFDECGLHVE